MSDRYFDPWTKNTFLTFTVTKFHESFETPFQKIEVFEALDYGMVLALGGVTNVTERDESGYHEMLTHMAMFAHPSPKRVLIIGGGDGGTLREVLRHPEVEEAHLVDIDGEVIRVSRQYFPDVAAALDHPKARVIVDDGVAFVERAVANREQYDLILVDSTDPVDAAVDLFTEGFYRNCAALLGENGILVPQSDSPSFYLDRVARIHELLSSIYKHARLYLGQTLSYPGCVWAFTAASQSIDVGAVPVPEARVAALEPELRVFNAEIMRACIALPNYIRRRITGQPGWALPTIADEVGPGTIWRPGTVKEAE